MKLKNKLAVITGGSSGIGLAAAETFLREGAKVAISGRDQDKLNRVKKDLGANAFCMPADVTHLADMQKFYKVISEHFGQKMDILVANAGISYAIPLKKTTPAEIEKIFNTNINGVFITVQQAVPYLNQGASIILMSSLAGKNATKDFSAYCASKAAVTTLAKCFAADLLDEKIRVNSLSPGLIKTPIFEGLGISAETFENWNKKIPLGRVGLPTEVAQVLVFLASEDSSYMTGADLALDGGISGIPSF